MNKLMSLFLIFSITASNLSFAEDKVIELSIGQIAPYTGYLFPKDKANQIKADLIEADLNKGLVESYKKSIDLYKANEALYQQKVDLYSSQNDKLAESLQSERSVSNWGRLAWFILGVGATIGAAYGLSRVK